MKRYLHISAVVIRFWWHEFQPNAVMLCLLYPMSLLICYLVYRKKQFHEELWKVEGRPKIPGVTQITNTVIRYHWNNDWELGLFLALIYPAVWLWAFSTYNHQPFNADDWIVPE